MLFFFPALVAHERGFAAGTCIYSANGVVSIVVHRGNRSADFDVIDLMDRICIALWVGYNSILFYTALEGPFTADLGCALIAAIAVIGSRMWVKTLEWRTLHRYIIHALMHSFGCIGSLYLLRATRIGY